ncbi:IS66 family transposase [Vagococcus silagei]|uniref:IS66 family transposase n=1 Tax=Vagococcus silagei TaxID=2508885 RepID=A0A4S3AZD5_9ENTE|nr:IS66 family transposase [Vagococcus silagei]THB60154.1 IS66 family transposase [Vagococcus silagei]
MTEAEKQLLKQNEQLLKQNEALTNELQLLREQVDYLTKKLFGRSSEQSSDAKNQMDLFNDDPSFNCAETTEEKTVFEEIKYKRKKKKGYKAELTKDLPIKEIHCDFEGQECTCDWCCASLKHIGKTKVREAVVFVPAKMYREVYYQHAYECPTCKKDGVDTIKKARVPKQPITHSLASPSILAQLIHQKIEMSLPFYRQEKEWEAYGLRVPRRTQSNWFITSCEKWLTPIWNELRKKLVSEVLIHADETYYNVLSSDKQKSYFWLFRTIEQAEQAEHPIILYHHELSRKSSVPRLFLEGFSGFLHCDGYSAYRSVDNVILVNCWAHVRRKFFEAKDSTSKKTPAAQGVEYCDKLFQIEKEIKGLPSDEKYQKRLERSQPILNDFWKWIESFMALPGSKLGKAVNYALNLKEGLMAFLKDGRCALSNNLAERSIRPTTIGRKNWMFSASERGATANGIAYSIVETAKANGLVPIKYFQYLFEHLPNIDAPLEFETLQGYLPWSDQIQSTCR